MDWLATKILDSFEEKEHMSPSWLAEKRAEYSDADRLAVLRWICHSLDAKNLAYAAQALNVSLDDLKATGRVLQKI